MGDEPVNSLERVLRYLSYLLSAGFFVGGFFIIFGMFIPNYVPKQFRISLGIVLVLWAIYRFVITRTKFKQYEEE